MGKNKKKLLLGFVLVWVIGIIGMTIFPDTKTDSSNTKQKISELRFNEDGSFKLDSSRASNDAEMEIYEKAKQDCEFILKDDIPKIIAFIKSNIDNPWKNESLMEQFIYLGTIIDNSTYSSEEEKSIGYKSKSIVSFVYRGLETVDKSKVGHATLKKRLNAYK